MSKKINLTTLRIPLLIIISSIFCLLLWQRGSFGTLDQIFYDRIIRYSVNAMPHYETSDDILYVLITDETYDNINKNYLPRRLLAKLNDVLSSYHAKLVLYDLIFSRKQSKIDDQLFYKSLLRNNRIFIPAGFGLDEKIESPNVDAKVYYKKFQETNIGNPAKVGRKYLPDSFFMNTVNAAGHVSAPADKDGVYRHFNLFVSDGPNLIPALSLIAFLDMMKVDSREVQIGWGNYVQIPLGQEGNKDNMQIPIDRSGRMVVPFVNYFSKEFESISIQDLLKLNKDNNSGNLSELIENRIIFIGDVSTGISDTGITPLENRVPLVALHAVLMNALLLKQFVREANEWEVLIIFFIVIFCFYFISLMKKRVYLNLYAVFLFLFFPIVSVFLHFLNYRFPAISFIVLVSFCFTPLFLIREVLIYKKNQQLRIDHDLVKQELSIANKIQKDLLPLNIQESNQYELQTIFHSAKEVGGDFFDIINIDNQHLYLAIGDVSGKGVSAALYMSAVVSSFRSIILNNSSGNYDLKKQIISLNRLLCYQSVHKQKTMFVTASFIYINLLEKRMQYIRCGHEVLLIKNKCVYDELSPKGMMLGVIPGEVFEKSLESFEKKLELEDQFLLFTDGVTEAMNENKTFFSIKRLKTSLEYSLENKQSLKDTSKSLLKRLLEFNSFENQYDDITYILFKWNS